VLRLPPLLGVLGGLRRPFERDFGRLIPSGVAQHAAAQLERLGVGLEGEGAVERQQRAVLVSQLVRRPPQLVPDEGQIGVGLHRPLQRGERVGVATQLDQRGTEQREGEAGFAELHPRALGELQRLRGAPARAQQLEVLRPTGLEVGMGRQQIAVRGLGVGGPALAGEPPRPRHRPLARCVGKQIVRRGGPHGPESTPRPLAG
jgi:hypothetical protein